MEKGIENILKNIKERKEFNKKFYNSTRFWEIQNSIKNIKGSILVSDKNIIQWIDSLLEMNRDKIFYESYSRYSLLVDNLIVEKHYKDEIMYVIHNKECYQSRLIN